MESAHTRLPSSFTRSTSLKVLCIFTFCSVGEIKSFPSEGTPQVTPNRTLPKISTPRTTLEFSANPTSQEIFRARVFEEPLVPIGAEPTAEENAALATALLGYAKRSGPDDFVSLTGFLEKHPKSPWWAA